MKGESRWGGVVVGGGGWGFFFFKQKTAYEIGTGDWSSDVCSSDLIRISMDKHQREIRQAKLKSQEFNSRLRDLTIAIRYALGC